MPGDIVSPHAMIESSSYVQALLNQRNVRTNVFTAHLKGIEGEVSLARLTLLPTTGIGAIVCETLTASEESTEHAWVRRRGEGAPRAR